MAQPLLLHQPVTSLQLRKASNLGASALHTRPFLPTRQRSARVLRAPAQTRAVLRSDAPAVQLQDRNTTAADLVETAPRNQTEQPHNPWWKRLLKSAAVGALALALALASTSPAEAARSGGRMGGSSFSSSRSYSSGSSSSRYSGSAGSLGSGAYSGSLRSAPSLAGPSVGFSSFFFPGSPWGYGYGYGSPGVVVSNGGGGGGLIQFFVLAAFALIAFNAVQSYTQGTDGISMGGERVAVAKLQVGLMGSARHLQRDLERIARRADTSSPEGLNYILQETVLALLRNPEYCVYGTASVKSKRSSEDAEEAFNRLSLQERGKFQQETLVNVGGRTRSASLARPASGNQELIVVTLLVAAEGQLKLPSVSSQEELRTALNRLGALRSDQVMAVEVVWTPQEEEDYYTREELFLDYPELHML